MGLLSDLYRRIVRGSDLEGVARFDRLAPDIRDEVFRLAVDLVKVEEDVRHLPPSTRDRLRQRFVHNHGIDIHPYSRTVYWIARHLREEGGGLPLSDR